MLHTYQHRTYHSSPVVTVRKIVLALAGQQSNPIHGLMNFALYLLSCEVSHIVGNQLELPSDILNHYLGF